MSLTASELTPADIAAVTGNNGNMGWGGDWWIILLFLFAFNGGWGGGFNGGAAPFMVNNDVQRGFDQSAIMNGLNGLTAAVTNGFATAELARANSNTDLLQALWGMQMNQQNCCCDTRAAITALGGTIASEGCETRFANANNTRDIIESNNRNMQTIMDKLCALELDAARSKIDDLQRELTFANMTASQTAQTSQILADNARQTVALEQYLNPAPVPAYVVQNPNCCNVVNSCGCGM